MLKPAQLYKDKLQEENIKSWYKPENIYWHGGRECAYFRQYVRLKDGKLHDSVSFEILAEEFKK